MKTLTIKLPLSIAQLMDDRAQLNPAWISDFLSYYGFAREVGDDDLPRTMLYTYSFKVDEDLHATIKDEAARQGLSITQYVRRLFEENYH